MAWKKIDDDQALPEMPYSSFLADGLSKNINAYPDALKTGGCISWYALSPPTWASYGDPQGTVVVINCGQNARQIDFRIGYQTVTANGIGSPPAAGKIVIQHLTTRVQASIDVPPSFGTLGTVNLTLELTSGVVTGAQAFLIAFQSNVVESLGTVDIYGGTQNEVYLHPRAGSTYTITTGKKYQAIDVTTSNTGVMSATDARKLYQLCYINTSVHPQQATATGVIWPELETVPQPIVNYVDNTKNHFGTVYELGAIQLYFAAYDVTQATDGTQIRQLSHGLTYSVQTMNNAQNVALDDFRPDIANNACDMSRLGTIVDGSTGDASISHAFCVQDNTEADVVASFHAIRLEATYDITFTLEVFDSGGTVIASTTLPTAAVGRMTYASTYTEEANKFRAMAGITSSPTQWGMIDSIPLVDTLKGTPIRMRIPNVNFDSVANSYLNTYTLRLSTSGKCYVFGYHAELD